MRTLLLGLVLAWGTMWPGSDIGNDTVIRVRRYADGRVSSREVHVRGRREGLQQSWWPNGRLRTQAWYRDDAYHGESRTWFEDGRPYELRHYDEGREAGVQQSWDRDGVLYLNYVVREGRRYGFVNAYPCQPAEAGEPDGGQS